MAQPGRGFGGDRLHPRAPGLGERTHLPAAGVGGASAGLPELGRGIEQAQVALTRPARRPGPAPGLTSCSRRPGVPSSRGPTAEPRLEKTRCGELPGASGSCWPQGWGSQSHTSRTRGHIVLKTWDAPDALCVAAPLAQPPVPPRVKPDPRGTRDEKAPSACPETR